jgi:hypothetical protein
MPSLKVSNNDVHFQLATSLYFLKDSINIGDEVNRNHDVCLPVFTVNVTFNRITLIVENEDDGLQPAPNHGRQLLDRQLTMKRMSAATLVAVKWNLQTAVAHE